MRKNAFKLFITIFGLLGFLILISCDKNNDSSNDNNDSNTYGLYIDSNPIEDDRIKIETDKPSCYSSGNNYSLTLRFTITNKEYVTNNYKFKNMSIIKELTGAKYTASGYFSFDNKLQIEAELNKSFTIESTIPSSIDDDKYKLMLEINDYKITYYFYETPDELREDRTINYYIDNDLVNTSTIKDGRTISNNYLYESSDNIFYCTEWYLDTKYQNKTSTSTVIKEDTNLYGKKTPIIKWMTTLSDVYSFVNGVNYVPSNGILVVPDKYLNKEICIGNYSIRNINVKKIYIPKTVHMIYSGNFTGINNATIYYEGTEAEWKSLFYNSREVVTTNVVFNTKYSKQ